MNISQIKAKKLENRMMDFALSCINLSKQASATKDDKIIIAQLVRAASSIGANYTEANNAVPRLDFRNKLYTAKKEAAESRYWLRLLDKAGSGTRLDGLINESTELLLILQKSVSTLKKANEQINAKCEM